MKCGSARLKGIWRKVGMERGASKCLNHAAKSTNPHRSKSREFQAAHALSNSPRYCSCVVGLHNVYPRYTLPSVHFSALLSTTGALEAD